MSKTTGAQETIRKKKGMGEKRLKKMYLRDVVEETLLDGWRDNRIDGKL